MQATDYPYLSPPTPVAMAHRGGAGYTPNLGVENTLAAFGRAVAMGYRYLETDVHATRDGVVVAFHDAMLDRVTDASGAVADLPWDAVREARVGGTEPIPRIGDLL
ncbi:MAG: glycerophosphodiester phosphodiesterase, partial [Phycicoccus sp.]